ncbi:MAG TPA: glycosyltransferase family 2 protein [Candidatus Angelobacter sp.]|jgi:glycosyltransferase involved in cell wall biosynthesis|nr:glycosyltransferase family 2 protein [Candidatus Angelobacter sp.]
MNLSERTQSLVSVLIRVRNEEHALRRLLECLRHQKLDRPFEVVVIDNESDDESAGVARTMGARVFTFPRSLFGYGRAINVGVKLCRGDLIVLLSAHSWPQGDDWLSRMVNCIEEGNVAAAYCRQITDGKVCRQEKRRFNVFAEHNYRLDAETLVERCKSGEDVYEVCCFSNAAAIFRREVVLRFPFRDLPFAEDRAFVLDCVMAGNSIAYLSTASVAYRQPASFQNFYRIGWACNISKQLIRELGSEAIGTDLRKSELGRKVVRLLCKPLEIIGRTMEALLRDRSQLGRATRYATISCAMSLGCIVGELAWHRYRKTTSCDSFIVLIAEKSIIVSPERMLATRLM